jgi:hypothetical protein
VKNNKNYLKPLILFAFVCLIAVAASGCLDFEDEYEAQSEDISPLLGSWTYGASAGGFDVSEYAMTGQGTYYPSFSIGSQYIFRNDNTYEYFWKSRNADQHDRGKFVIISDESGTYIYLYDRVDQHTGNRKGDEAYYIAVEHSNWGRNLKVFDGGDWLTYLNDYDRRNN